jgi:hypothetical protein
VPVPGTNAGLNMNLKALIAGAALAATIATGAQADTYSYDINATDFTCSFGPDCGGSAPWSTVKEDFTVTLDPTAITGPTTSGLNITLFTLPYSSQFTYAPGGYPLTVATTPGPAYPFFAQFSSFPDSYGLFIDAPLGNPSGEYFSYDDSSGTIWVANSIAVAFSVTPLPSTWLMLISGFIALGFFAYCGSKKNAAALAAA